VVLIVKFANGLNGERGKKNICLSKKNHCLLRNDYFITVNLFVVTTVECL
jgi:hypothetical protein